MAEIEGLVRALREGDDAAQTAAARALRRLANSDAASRVRIAEAGGIAPLVELVRDGSANAKLWAAWALGNLACNAANTALIAEADGVARLLELLRDGSADTKWSAAYALGNLARNNAANKVAIAEAGGVPPLVELVRDGSEVAKEQAVWALRNLARNNDANAIAIAVTVGFEALVQLARRGSVTVGIRTVVRDAALPAKRKAALVVAALLRACVPEEVRSRVPYDVNTAIVSYL